MADISSITLPDGSQYYFKDIVARAQGMVVLTYGTSTYAECLAAYQSNKLVYCRADKRMAFLAYVNDTTTPTEFEFQYYRSVASHTSDQQGDQVFIYKLNSSGTWSTTTREAYTKVIAGTNLTSTYANGALTLNSTASGNAIEIIRFVEATA